MNGKLSSAGESRKLLNHLRQAHAKLEVIIHSDDATIHFVGRVAFVSKEKALLVNVTTESFVETYCAGYEWRPQCGWRSPTASRP
jgi:hypothetical protein